MTEVIETPLNSSILPGVNVLLMGPAGTGKTFITASLAATGLEVFFLSLEPGMESFFAYWKDRGKEIPENVHWHSLPAADSSLEDMISAAEKINQFTFESISKMQDPNKRKYNQFVSLLKVLNDFPDDRTGQTFGPVHKWDQSRVLICDGLTGINNSSMAMVIGGKPVKSPGDWGVAQDQVYKICFYFTNVCNCHFVLVGHIEREIDQVLGGTKIMISTLGKALPGKIPPLFSDVILTVREGATFYWDTASATADVKTRNLPIENKIKPDFAKIIAKWKSRGGNF